MWLVSLGLTLIAAIVFFIPLYLILNRTTIHNGKKTILYLFFSLYLAAVYELVGMPNVTYIRFEINLNLIPFLGFFQGMRSSLLNILLFVPLGMGLPVLWEKYRSVKHTVCFGFGLSLVIELLQMLTYRATDVNDLMTNTLGAFLGWLLGDCALKKIPGLEKLTGSKSGELYLVCTITAVVMFFAQPFVFSLLWDLVMH